LKYRQLGASDLRVSIISLGSWLTYSGGVEKRQALACVHKALDLGINFIDTANVYGRGAAESVLGEALHGIDRTSYMLATKVFGAMSDTDRGLSSSQIVTQLNASLKRLGTDYIDLYQCHRFDEETPPGAPPRWSIRVFESMFHNQPSGHSGCWRKHFSLKSLRGVEVHRRKYEAYPRLRSFTPDVGRSRDLV